MAEGPGYFFADFSGTSIGANATIICGITIGRWAFIGAGAVVREDVPDYAVVAGVPARIIGWMCECGNRLRFKNGTVQCPKCSPCYRKIEMRVEEIL